MTRLHRGGLVVELQVESVVSGQPIMQFVISNSNLNETYSGPALGLKFTGGFGVITENASVLSALYPGEGSSLSFGGYGVASVAETNPKANRFNTP